MRQISLLTIITVAGLCLATGAAKAGCEVLDAKIRTAIETGAMNELPALAQAISAEPSCDGSYVDAARRSMALTLLASGQNADGAFDPAKVEAAAAIARPWQVNAAYGDLAYSRGDYVTAVGAYEGAINEIRNVTLVPDPPSGEMELYLAKRAYQAKSLAPTYIASRGFRGEPAGVIVPKFRNFSAVTVPIPVRFLVNEATLTPDGASAVDDLFNFLSSQNVRKLKLIGHTDETGSADYNRGLSLARAESVATALRAKGYAADIEIVGAGESQPFEADDRSKYGQEDLYSFDRRVEFEVVE
jgi:outer membrane protein OmpA-like peptidoglycan-associated protein